MNKLFLSVAIVLASPAFAQTSQPQPQAAKAPATGIDLKRAQEIVNGRCSLCHGAEGESASPIFPRLAGQHPEYIVKQLTDFREGRRKGTMNDQAKELSDDEIRALSLFFAQKKPKAYSVADPDLAAVGRYIYHKGNGYSGVAACASCHGPNGDGTAQLPRLAGQHASYLETQLKEFNKRERTNDNAIMHAIASKLTELEMRAVAVYLSGKL